MLRSAAKNHESVTVIVDHADYEVVADELKKNGDTTLETRRWLALKVFQRTSAYDGAIAAYLQANEPNQAGVLPQQLSVSMSKVQDLRYGENPHQRAALYGEFR